MFYFFRKNGHFFPILSNIYGVHYNAKLSTFGVSDVGFNCARFLSRGTFKTALSFVNVSTTHIVMPAPLELLTGLGPRDSTHFRSKALYSFVY